MQLRHCIALKQIEKTFKSVLRHLIYCKEAQCSSQVYVHDLHWNMQRVVYSAQLLLLLLLHHYYYSTMKYVESGLHIAHPTLYLVRRSNLHLIASMCDQVLQIDWFNCWGNRLICTRRLSASHRAYCSWDVVFTNSDKKIILTNGVDFWNLNGKEKMPYIYGNCIQAPNFIICADISDL